MPRIQDAKTALDRCFLDLRGKIIEIAAHLDRIEGGRNADDIYIGDRRMHQVGRAIFLLDSDYLNKAERCQMAFSLPYKRKPITKPSIVRLWTEFEQWVDHSWDPLDEFSNVVVDLSDGTRWVATFFTYANIATLRKKLKADGEHLSGKYFCATDMILIDELSRESVTQVIEDMIRTDDLKTFFEEVSPDCEDIDYERTHL